LHERHFFVFGYLYFGILTTMYTSETSVRVRYGETDQMGYVYYGVYAMYYEVARVESLRKLGLSYRSVEEMGVMMPVIENHSRYLAPGRYDDLLRIVTTLREKPTARIKFEYEIFNETNVLIHQGETVLVFIDKKTNRPCRAPQAMADVLSPYFT
jgi:acyl-CoA thioester hydrolase